MKRNTLALFAFAILAFAPPAAHAQLAQSHFTTGTEGWLLGDYFLNDGFADHVGYNNAGYLSVGDWYGTTGFVAPTDYLGDKSGAYGHNFDFSIYSYYASAYTFAPLMVISDGTLNLQFMGNVPPQQSWTDYAIPFIASAGWQVETVDDFSDQTPATEAQLQQVLGNLEYVHVLADFHEGGDLVYLDDVVMEGNMTSTPEPASIVLLGSGLLGIGALARRRVRTMSAQLRISHSMQASA